jgi:predicted ribonuclease YlaK
MKMNLILLDTNVLMNKIQSGSVVLPVVQELDGLKNAEGLKGKQARDAIFRIYSNPEKYPIILPENGLERLQDETVDDYLVRVAETLGMVLHTYDLSLYLKAISKGAEAIFMGAGDHEQENYSGMIYQTPEQYAEMCVSQKFEAPDNAYVIYENAINRIEKNTPKKILYRKLSTDHTGDISSKNPEQSCLIDALYGSSPVVIAAGLPGSGKSFLCLSYALQELQKGNYSKIVVVPNNSFVADSREIAAVPGGLLEKEFMHLGPLIDILGIFEIEKLIQEEKLEIMPVAISRGRSLTDSIVYVSEAQNLSEAHIKLLISRIGEGSRVFFDGDHRGQQTDKGIFKRNSGLRLLMRLAHTDHSHMISMVKLIKTERSSTAQLADALDKLETE